MERSTAIDMMWLPYEPQCVWLDARAHLVREDPFLEHRASLHPLARKRYYYWKFVAMFFEKLSLAQVRASVEASASRLRQAADDSWACVLPLTHVGGISILFRCLHGQSEMVLMEGSFDALGCSRLLQEGRVSQISLVPNQLHSEGVARRVLWTRIELEAALFKHKKLSVSSALQPEVEAPPVTICVLRRRLIAIAQAHDKRIAVTVACPHDTLALFA